MARQVDEHQVTVDETTISYHAGSGVMWVLGHPQITLASWAGVMVVLVLAARLLRPRGLTFRAEPVESRARATDGAR